ncbi:flagellar protein FlaG [Pseudoalteromonas sp. SSDWG2]|uniref:flagellar protein FlaG n=1 Tax=Pseudoalteromonas sp. SSDWG2 TaxID=3139391 RepID=UPI003BAAF464
MIEIKPNQDVASILQKVPVQNRQQDTQTEDSNPAPQDVAKVPLRVTEPLAETNETDSKASFVEQVTQQQQERMEELKESLEKLNEFIPIRSTNLIFEFDELGDPPVIKVVDRDSEEVIREIPPREFREMAKALEDFADKLDNRGMIFNQSA